MFIKVIIMCSMLLSQAASSLPHVEFKTSLGDFTVELDADKAPITVKNFMAYVNSGFYTDTLFHRVINGFMIQGGGFNTDLQQKDTQPPIAIESQNGLKNAKYTIAMARTSDPSSATSQFFINVVDNTMLDYPNPDGHGYAVFGKVTSGFDVIDTIKAVATQNSRGMGDVPVTPVVIYSVTVANPT